MKNLFTYLKALWSSMVNSQKSDMRHDCRLTVDSPSGLDAKWKQSPFMRFAVVLTLIFSIGVGNVWGAEELVYTLDGTITGSGSGYASANDITQSSKAWKVTGNTTMNPWRIGGKSISGVNRPIYTTFTFTEDISKVEVETGSTGSSLTINSITLKVSSSQNGGGTVTSTITKNSSLTNTTLTFARPDATDWSGKYFTIIFNVTRTSSSGNGYIEFKNAKFYKETGGGCDKSVTLAQSVTNGSATFSPTGPVATCSATASDRQVSVSITPTTGYALTSGPSVSGVTGATISGSGPYTIQLPQNGNGTLTLSATCSAIAVTGVSLNKSSTTIVEGSTETLTATVSPSNALNKAVTWSSDAPGVATVNSSGVVTAVSAGSATITVTTTDGGYTANCTVTVTAAARDHFIDAMHSTTGYTGDGMEKVGNYSASIPTIADKAKNTTGTCAEKHYHFAGWVTAANRANPEGNLVTLDGNASNTTYYAVWEKEGAGGGSLTKMTKDDDFAEGDKVVIIAEGTRYGMYREDDGNNYVKYWTTSDEDGVPSLSEIEADSKRYLEVAAGSADGTWLLGDATNGYLYNSSSTNLAFNTTNSSDLTLIIWNDGTFTLQAGQYVSCRTDIETANANKWRGASSSCVINTGSNCSGTPYYYIYKYVSVSYEDPKVVCEACVATPSIASVSLTGSSFSTTSVPVQATGASAGDNCSLASYGFYWGGSANPSTNNTASDNLSTGTFSATLTGPFTIGETYHYRAYATNEAPNTGYSSDATFTLRQVSFNMHSHGGDAPATQVVPQGGKATDPGNPSATGWTFGGWYDNDSYTGSAWNFGTNTVGSGNVTLHAKWTEKPKYTITLNAGNGTVSEAGWEKDGDVWKQQQSNGDASITFPSASSNCAGWEFVGWATSAANNVSSDPTSKAAGATLVPASNVTYYAVYRQSSAGGTTYSKITSAGDLTTGNYAIMAAFSTTYYAMGNSISGTYMAETSYSSATDSWTNSDADYIWKIIKFGDKVVFYNADIAKYLSIVDGAWVLATEGQLFTYSFNSTTKAWTFTSPSGKQLAYSTRFYVGDSQSKDIYLYKQGSTPSGNFYTNPTCSDLSITGVADPAAGGSVTLSATSAKSGEKVYAYYTADDDYNFTSWSISGTGSTLSSTSAQFTEITVGTANTTVTANFAAKDWKTVTWKANGEALTGGDLGSASVKVENGYDITAMPPTPASCDGTSTNFIGWVAESDIWSGKTDDVSGVTIYEKTADFPTVTGNVVYHAVWAHQIGTPIAEIEDNSFTSKDENGSYCNAPFSLKAAGKYLQKQSIWTSSQMQNVTVKIRVFHVANNTAATLRVSLINSDGDEVVGSDLTAGVTGNNISDGGYTDWVELIPTSAVTGYKVSMKTPATFGTAISKVAREVVGSGAEAYLVKCCNTPTLTFAASPYAVLREDIQGASTTTWAEVDVTFTSNSSGTISVPDYGSSKSVYKLSAWESRATTGGTLCTTDHAYLEVLDQPDGETPGTGKFYVKTTSGQTGQGTYRIAITQEATDESHGNFCETTVYGFVDVTLRDKFVDNVNGNGTINRNGHGAELATPTLSELDTQDEDACHDETRKLKGWIKESDLKSDYVTGTRVTELDNDAGGFADLVEAGKVVAPGTNVTMSGVTWYAVWAYEK